MLYTRCPADVTVAFWDALVGERMVGMMVGVTVSLAWSGDGPLLVFPAGGDRSCHSHIHFRSCDSNQAPIACGRSDVFGQDLLETPWCILPSLHQEAASSDVSGTAEPSEDPASTIQESSMDGPSELQPGPIPL